VSLHVCFWSSGPEGGDILQNINFFMHRAELRQDPAAEFLEIATRDQKPLVSIWMKLLGHHHYTIVSSIKKKLFLESNPNPHLWQINTTTPKEKEKKKSSAMKHMVVRNFSWNSYENCKFMFSSLFSHFHTLFPFSLFIHLFISTRTFSSHLFSHSIHFYFFHSSIILILLFKSFFFFSRMCLGSLSTP
jgi:hypothetical protein